MLWFITTLPSNNKRRVLQRIHKRKFYCALSPDSGGHLRHCLIIYYALPLSLYATMLSMKSRLSSRHILTGLIMQISKIQVSAFFDFCSCLDEVLEKVHSLTIEITKKNSFHVQVICICAPILKRCNISTNR